MERLTVDYGKKFSPFRYAMKDGSDAEIGYFKNYDAFYSHMLMVQKLGEYEDLEEQGLLLRLPCKVGTEVWTIMCGMTGKHPILFKQYFELSMLQYWGKAVFLTKAEAEQKLKEMERD